LERTKSGKYPVSGFGLSSCIPSFGLVFCAQTFARRALRPCNSLTVRFVDFYRRGTKSLREIFFVIFIVAKKNGCDLVLAFGPWISAPPQKKIPRKKFRKKKFPYKKIFPIKKFSKYLERSVPVEMDGEIETDADHDRNPQSWYSVGSRGSSLDPDGNVPDGPFPPFVISRQPLAIQDHITFGADFSARFRVFSFSNLSWPNLNSISIIVICT